MASSEICPHGYPSPKSCMTCLEDDGVGAEPVRPLTSEGPTFTANYDGQCSGVGACNLPIKEGQRITRMSDGTYRHVGCAS